MIYYDDTEAWPDCPPEDLWVFDKLIVSKTLGYNCGPHGVDVPEPGNYIVRPSVNLMGMGRSAQFMYIEKSTDDILEDGTFWCEIFEGRHLSVDYIDGEQVLCVEGIKRPGDPLWRWREWKKVEDVVPLPEILAPLKSRHKTFNIEMIGGKIIEIHLRLNPDFRDRDVTSIIPRFEGDIMPHMEGYRYISDPADKRLAFFVK